MADNISKFNIEMVAWAEKVAEQYVEHGLPEGDAPARWCNDALLDSVIEEPACMEALFEVAKNEFLAACARLGHS